MKINELSINSRHVIFEQDGMVDRMSYSLVLPRRDEANFAPTDASLSSESPIDVYFMRGLAPEEPVIDKDTPVVAFGSCFAGHIVTYLRDHGFNVPSPTL